MIGGKKYMLTANRSIIKTLYQIAPDLLKLSSGGKLDNETKAKAGIDLTANLDILFYDMIKVANKDITKEKSDEILEKFDNEYEDVQTALLDFAMSCFPTGDQKKKQVVWED